MDNQKRLSLRTSRDIYLMLGDCRSLGSDGLCWRQFLVQRIRKLFDADMVYLADNLKVGEPESADGWLRPLCIVDDWRDNSVRDVFWGFVREGRAERTPLSLLIDGTKSVVARRRDLVSDCDWYESEFYRKYLSKARLDDWVTSSHHLDGGVVQVLFLQRSAGRQPFSEDILNAIRTIGKELSDWQPHPLASSEQSVFSGLTERLRQTLSLLITGNSTKAIAEQLGISKHTAQVHVKRLYKLVGVSNRSELCALSTLFNHKLTELPSFEDSDHHEQITNATRKPWPKTDPETSSDL